MDEMGGIVLIPKSDGPNTGDSHKIVGDTIHVRILQFVKRKLIPINRKSGLIGFTRNVSLAVTKIMKLLVGFCVSVIVYISVSATVFTL